MDGFFVAKLKKFAPGERKMLSTASGVPDKDAPEANEAGGDVDEMEMDFEDRWVPFVPVTSLEVCFYIMFQIPVQGVNS